MSEIDVRVNDFVELYDSDLKRIRSVLHEVNAKFARERDTKENLRALVHVLEDKFHDIGLEISLPMSKRIAWAMGVEPTEDMPTAITISIDSRTIPQEFDHDQMAWESNKVIIPDSVARKFTEQGGTVAEDVSLDTALTPKEQGV